MDLFRRKQKLIFWIVTIIIVPSFVLVWGVSGRYGGREGVVDYDIGTIGGQTLKYHEFDAFRKRIQAAIGSLPLQFPGAPGAQTPSEEIWKYFLTYAIFLDAEKAGDRASDLQVGTYIENSHPVLAGKSDRNDPKALERAVDSYCRQMQITRQEFLKGVRDWQTLGNYVFADSYLSSVNDDTIFAYYSLTKAECIIKRVKIPETEDIKEQARKDITGKPAEELDKEIRDYAASKSSDRRYRNSSGWRFAYVLTPFVADSSVRQPTESEIKEVYESGKNTQYKDTPQAEAEEQIKAALVHQEVERQTLRNLTVDVDTQLRGQGGDLALPELVKLTQLAKYGVTAGDTGSETLDVADVIKKLPAGAEPQIATLLEAVDAEPAAARDAFIADWEKGFNLTGRPFRCDAGFFRLRLLGYRPSTPSAVTGADGSIRPQIRELALSDMIGDRADALVEEKARTMERRIRDYMEAKEKGQPAPDTELAKEFDALPTETIPYSQLADNNYALGRLVVGDLQGPNPYTDTATGVSGQELLVLVERRLPTRADLDAEPAEVKSRLRQMASSYFAGNFGFSYSMQGPVAVIHPGPTIMGGIVDRLARGEIGVNQELLRHMTPEG